MFHQLISPVGDSLTLSFVVACVPIAVVLMMLGVARRPAWQASLSGLIVAAILAVSVWQLPPTLAANSVAAGVAFALWPIMWIVFNAIILYNVTVRSGRFDAFRHWLVANLPRDRRIVLVVVGFSFGCLLEGIAGFGTPVAITSALLIALGFRALDALVFTLIFNTAPVAFGALGSPVTTLGVVTQLPDTVLGAMIGRQLPLIATLLPFYAIVVYGGVRALKGVWPALLVVGASFGVAQFVTSNYLGYALTDVVSSLVSLAASFLFLRFWKPRADPAHAIDFDPGAFDGELHCSPWQGWLPWLILSAVVIAWLHLGVPAIGAQQFAWPGLHEAVFITAYGKPYAAIWNFQPLATGTAILAATIITAVLMRLPIVAFRDAVRDAARQVWLPAITTSMILGLAFLLNYSGIAYTLGIGVASAGFLFPLLSAFLGWLAVFLSGSDTSGNALFGNMQIVAAHRIGLDPVLMAATNSSGGVMGKMISPQNICTGTAITGMQGQEGVILARTFKHSIILTLVLGIMVMAQQYLFPGVIPK